MGNVMFCPQLNQAGIDYVSGTAAVGAGVIFTPRRAPLLETYKSKDSQGQQKDGVRFELPPETKDLAHYGFDYRFTDETTREEGGTSSKEFNFTTRLYHTKSNTMITRENFRKFGLHGKLLERVSDCCQDIVQQELQDFYRYNVVKIPASSHKTASAATASGSDATKPPIQAFVSPDLTAETLSQDQQSYSEPQHAPMQEKPILLMLCGKGESRAGVLSTKQLVLSGIESGSAVFHILQAQEEEMSVILLDPNAWGENRGMEVINHSLSHLFGGGEETAAAVAERTKTGIPAIPGLQSKRPLYVLAHSASGGYLTRYLSQGVARETLLPRIRRIVFTDSTHNLQWYKSDPQLWKFLQSDKCLYIRNNSAPRAFGNHHGKRGGERHEGDHWWHHRFGSIPTVWAGTPEHSLMCWTARHVIWKFFTEGKHEITFTNE